MTTTKEQCDDANHAGATPNARANYLSLRCPNCLGRDRIDVLATLWVRVTPRGADANGSANSNPFISPFCRATCTGCGHRGVVAGFTPPAGEAINIVYCNLAEASLRP